MGQSSHEGSADESRDDILSGSGAHLLESGGGPRRPYGPDGIHAYGRIDPTRAVAL
ncbi:hypothetical protein ACQP1K_29190 (plasmid) [Sphaerimonospora sp. CA-214678]|uniref:hypothetical protein n=1 Tax=Sphaerimonospora sp. CA-214678 TaxID=3240029 RepID=UPI003D92A0A6